MKENYTIGKNIRTARREKGMTQRQLAESAELSQTQLSDYENDNKIPGLYSLAKIAQSLKKSIDELYYGNASVSFITSAPNKGAIIVNSFVALWEQGIIDTFESKNSADNKIALRYCVSAIKRLMSNLHEFECRKPTYSDPNGYLEYVKQSITNEISQQQTVPHAQM